MIEFINVTKRFPLPAGEKIGEAQTVLNDVSLHIRSCAITGIVGAGGSGKTILLKTGCSLMKPDSGVVLVNGLDVYGADEYSLKEIRSKFGVLFQNFAMFDFLNLYDNIAFPLVRGGADTEREIDHAVMTILEEVGLAGWKKAMTSELSGGMLRRAALARAMVTKPLILVLDDPTSGLDPVNSSRIFLLIKKKWEEYGPTVLVSSHDVDRLIQICSDIVVIHHGKIRFHGICNDLDSSDDEIVIKMFRGAD